MFSAQRWAAMACWAGGPSTAGGTPVLADSRVSTAPLLGDSTLEETVSRRAAWQHHGSYTFSLAGAEAPTAPPLSGSRISSFGHRPCTFHFRLLPLLCLC